MLEPLGEHDLLVFWAQLFVLLVVARGLGLLVQRVGQPAVVGELAAGLLIGPSVFGRFAPGAAEWLFPGGVSESAPLLAVAWLGVALLLVLTGYETDLKLLANLGNEALSVSAGSLVVPLGFGFAVGLGMPAVFQGDGQQPIVFAAFIAVAMSISALPVVARVLGELELMRRNIGQITVAAAMVNDLIGWLLLGTLSGIVVSGGFDLVDTLVTVGLVAALFALALTVGQRLVDWLLRRGLAWREAPTAVAFSAAMLVVFALATLTQAIGVEAVLGAFLAGILLGRSRYRRPQIEHTIELLSTSVVAPIFFATAGIYVDLGALADPAVLTWAGIILAVAMATKLGGSYLGGRIVGMPNAQSYAIGIGLNARGAMEIVLATIAFSLGVFNDASYTVIVLMAMATSIVAPPLLRRALRGLEPSGDEARRLEREELLAASVIADTDAALVPTRGGENSQLAARIIDRILKPDARVTVLTVHRHGTDDAACRCDEVLREIGGAFADARAVERRRANADGDPADAILAEANLGYGLIVLGMTEDFRDTHELSVTLRRVMMESRVPVLLVRHGTREDTDGRTRRIVAPAVGTRAGRAAEEVAFALAMTDDAVVDLVHVVSRADRDPQSTGSRLAPLLEGMDAGQRATVRPAGAPPVEGVLASSMSRAERFGVRSSVHIRAGSSVSQELITAANLVQADLLVTSAQVRNTDGDLFLGHGTEYLLEHASQTLVVVLFPDTETT